MRAVVLGIALALCTVATASKHKKYYDSDFLFEEDDWKQKKEQPAVKTWIWDPENGLCSALECRSNEMCLLEDSFTAVCVSRTELKTNGDRIISRQLAEDEHLIKSQPWMSDEDTDDDDDEDEDDEIDLDDDDDDHDDDEEYDYDEDEDDEDDDDFDNKDTGDVQIIESKKEMECRECPYTHPSVSTYICGTDNRTYSSLCRLEQHNCVHQTFVTTDCKGFCPCRVSGSYRKKKDQQRLNVYKAESRFQKSKYNKSKLKSKYEKYHKEKNSFNNVKYYPKNDFKNKYHPKCSSDELSQMGTRLVDWFAVLKERKSSEGTKASHNKYYTTHFPQWCKPVAQWMYLHLDTDSDTQLTQRELFAIEKDQPEKCLKSFLDRCDLNGDIFLTSREWCQCFDTVKQPCLERRNVVTSHLGAYLPSCDEDGFYRATQCQGSQCWCVDRHGTEKKGTRGRRGTTNCDGDTVRPDFNVADEDDEDNYVIDGSGAGLEF